MSISKAGTRIQELRQAKGWSQRELGKKVALTGVTIGGYEANEREPKASDLIRIANALGTTASYLLGEIDDASPSALLKIIESPLGQVRPGGSVTQGELERLDDELRLVRLERELLERIGKLRAEREGS